MQAGPGELVTSHVNTGLSLVALTTPDPGRRGGADLGVRGRQRRDHDGLQHDDHHGRQEEEADRRHPPEERHQEAQRGQKQLDLNYFIFISICDDAI